MDRGIQRLTIKGFKSIRELVDFEMRPLNVLIGANGSGKSNFLGFLSLLRDIANNRLNLEIRRLGGADTYLYLGPSVTSELLGGIKTASFDYRFALIPSVADMLMFVRESLTTTNQTDGFAYGHTKIEISESKINVGASNGEPLAAAAQKLMRALTPYHFRDTGPTAAIRRAGSPWDSEYLRPDAANLAAFLLKLSITRQREFRRIEETVALAVPFFRSFRLVEPPREQSSVLFLEWNQKGTEHPFQPWQLSDGTLRFMALATALLQPEPPPVMIFDEPELGLHPYAIELVAEMLRSASHRSQIIVATQSPQILEAMDPEDVVVVNRSEGQSTFRRLESEPLKEWLVEYSLGDLWRKNHLEGNPTRE